MPTPTTRDELLRLVRDGREQLEADVARFGNAEMLAAEPGQWSLKDVLAHIAAWQRYACEHFAAAARGEEPSYRVTNGAEVDQFNAEAYERFRDSSLEDVLAEFRAAHADLLAWLERLPDDLLFDSEKVPWNRGHSLAWTVGANTFWHYEEHADRLKL